MAGVNFIERLYEKCTCSICLDYFTDPVSTDCGHSFCRACLIQAWGTQGGNPSCPRCQEPATPAELLPNPALSTFVEISKEFSLQAAKGTVCQRHLEPLELFCRDDKAPICAECHKSELHREHTVIPGRDAAEECKQMDSVRSDCLQKD